MLKLDTQFPLINNQINHLVFFQENNANYILIIFSTIQNIKGSRYTAHFFRCGFLNFRNAPKTLVL